MTDDQFFATYPDRRARIRNPDLVRAIDRQRGVGFVDECEREFQSLGGHRRDRRRILLWRVPPGNPWYDPMKPAILKIPLLAFSDETIEDRDDILLPIIYEIMMNARVNE